MSWIDLSWLLTLTLVDHESVGTSAWLFTVLRFILRSLADLYCQVGESKIYRREVGLSIRKSLVKAEIYFIISPSWAYDPV